MAELAYLGQVILAGGSYASLRDLAEYGATLAFDDAETFSSLRPSGPQFLIHQREGHYIAHWLSHSGRAPDTSPTSVLTKF